MLKGDQQKREKGHIQNSDTLIINEIHILNIYMSDEWGVMRKSMMMKHQDESKMTWVCQENKSKAKKKLSARKKIIISLTEGELRENDDDGEWNTPRISVMKLHDDDKRVSLLYYSPGRWRIELEE